MAQDVQFSLNAATSIPSQSRLQLHNWLRLEQVKGVGIATLKAIKDKFGVAPFELLSMRAKDLAYIGFSEKQQNSLLSPNLTYIESELDWLQMHPLRYMLTLDNIEYPERLKHIHSPPMILRGLGHVDSLSDPQIAVVGSRNPSHYGKQCAFDLAQQLVCHGLGVTSGLAIGIDSQAHRGAISGHAASDGSCKSTIAVLGSGLNHIYPKRNVPLFEQIIASGGTVVSEFSANMTPRPEHFPRRNRIVSGLSLGVVVIEALIRSGSLTTVKSALDQSRDVFALPGSIHNPLSEASHFLIKQGAKVVTTVDDILDEFQSVKCHTVTRASKKLEKIEEQGLASDTLLDSVDHDVTALDVIIQRSNLPLEEVMAKLLQYQLRGLVTPASGGYIKLRGK